jgi:diacylglycerol kinase family enzyme
VRVTLLHNPGAGDEEHSADELVAAIAEHGHDVEYALVKEDAWWETVERAEPELVVVAGGDGAVRRVFTRLAGSDVPVTILPLGTANNIAVTLGFDTSDTQGLIDDWASFELRRYDIGELQHASGTELFVEGVGGGLFAELLVAAERGRAEHLEDKIERGIELLGDVLGELPAAHWRLSLDGEELAADLLGFEAMTTKHIGPAVRIAPDADPSDGFLDVVLIPPETRAGLLDYVQVRASGDERAMLPPLPTRRVRELSIRPTTGAAVHHDDALTALPDAGIRAVAAAAHVQVRVPRQR